MKIAEAAKDLANTPSAKKVMMKSPKVFKFGTEEKVGREFRFSLLPPQATVNGPTQSSK